MADVNVRGILITHKVGWEIMKLNKIIVAIISGAALIVGTVAVVSMTGQPKAPEIASTSTSAVNQVISDKLDIPVDNKIENPAEKAAPAVVASAQSMADSRTSFAALKAALPQSIPVPCPIWILGQLAGYSKTTIKTADGGPPNPELVPGAIWVMQKVATAAAKTL